MSSNPIAATPNPLNVLVVEDHLDAARILAQLLEMFGHTVRLARTGPVALEMCALDRPDVVLLDLALPGIDGYEVAARLRSRPDCRNITICAVTGFSLTESEKQKLSRSGFNHYFTKPMDVTKVAHVFDHIVPAAR
ncbi:response regulator [Planctomyces sp. SH-PL14]|uniref:response regulator n=1 Tax=Planctomyces sp. SH-PL14 TaxID=1632864 RepID=UPI00078C7DA6|nr:response regulator [Planctomyces sp. SH-PL14]AMV21739.1 Polar-differentiation response regulator DivK [Planctomyces sp. SH-PL14]